MRGIDTSLRPKVGRLTVSRPARLKKQQFVTSRHAPAHSAHSLPRYVASVLRSNNITDRQTLDYAVKRAERYTDEFGIAPSPADILNW